MAKHGETFERNEWVMWDPGVNDSVRQFIESFTIMNGEGPYLVEYVTEARGRHVTHPQMVHVRGKNGVDNPLPGAWLTKHVPPTLN